MRCSTIVVSSLLPLLLGVHAPSVASVAEAEPRDEYTVKAAFILNFARLTTWPDSALSEHLEVCIVGPAPLAARMVRLMEQKSVRGHRVMPRAIESAEGLGDCHMVFIIRDADDAGREHLLAVEKKAIMVVGETAGFAGRGAVINFYEESHKIRFEVNRHAARRQRLQISSRLLGLARIVPDTSAPEERLD